ncbi:MAG: hypothetical protein VYA84_12070 [Planctomycetota bacterium]|nr:hypothetical protein [Planctomycetota bacterium]
MQTQLVLWCAMALNAGSVLRRDYCVNSLVTGLVSLPKWKFHHEPALTQRTDPDGSGHFQLAGFDDHADSIGRLGQCCFGTKVRLVQKQRPKRWAHKSWMKSQPQLARIVSTRHLDASQMNHETIG